MSFSQKIILLVNSDQEQPESVIILPKPQPCLVIIGSTFPPPPQPRLVVITTKPPKFLFFAVVAFLRSPRAHSLIKPNLPNLETLKSWEEEKWENVPPWIDWHFIACENFERGDSTKPIFVSLPTSVRRRMYKEMGFGDIPIVGSGLSHSYVRDILKVRFQVCNPDDTRAMIYVFFHIKTGKLYVGSAEDYLTRLEQHFFSATVISPGATAKTKACSDLYWAIRTSVLSDWKIIALKKIDVIKERYEIEGWWIDRLKSLKSKHGFNNGAPASTYKEPSVHCVPELKCCVDDVKHALKSYRKRLGLCVLPSPEMTHALKNVVEAFSWLQFKLKEGGFKFRQQLGSPPL